MKIRLQNIIFTQKALPEFDYEVKKVDYSDGLKIYFENGWLTCRFSGTEPMIRIFIESTNIHELNHIEARFKEFIYIN